MSYLTHNFRSGDRLYASQLNEMDEQIASIASRTINILEPDVNQIKTDVTDLNHDVFGWKETERVPTRYYKIAFDEVWRSDRNSVSASAALSEISFYDETNTKKTVSSVVADSEYSSQYAASTLIDDDLSTMWSSKDVTGAVHTLVVTLSVPSIITRIGMVPRINIASGVPNIMTIYASEDCSEWTEVAHIADQKDNWVEGEWRYFDLVPIFAEHIIPSVREELEIVKIVAETDPCETSHPSELKGLIESHINKLIVHGNDDAFGKAYVSDCENLIPSKYDIRTDSPYGVTFSSYYRYFIINGDGSGTGNAFNYIVASKTKVLLPENLKQGDTYKVVILTNKDIPSNKARMCITFNDNTYAKIRDFTHNFQTTREFTGTVPENAVYWRISFEGIDSSYVWDDVRIYPIIIKNDSKLIQLSDASLGNNEQVEYAMANCFGWDCINTFQYQHSYKYKIDTKTYVDNHTSKAAMTYTTPEDFGAVGDGIFDDTASINSCMDYAFENNIPVRMYKTYLVSDSVKIKNDMDVHVNRLIYTGTDTAILLDCARSNVYIGNLLSNAKGVCLRSDTTRVEYNLIRIGYADCKTHCISLEDTAKAIFQNKFEFRYLKAGGDGCYCITTKEVPLAKYLTENTFYGGQATNADWAFYGGGGNSKFYDIQVETNIKGGFCFVDSANALICGDRNAESQRDGEYPYIKIVSPDIKTAQMAGNFCSLRYITPIGLTVNEIDLSEVYPYYNPTASSTLYAIESTGNLGKIDSRVGAYRLTGTSQSSRYQTFGKSATIWGNVLIFNDVPYRRLTVTESLDLRTIGEQTPAPPTTFEIGCENCEIHLHPTYCFMGLSKFEVIQTDTYQAKIYDYYSGNCIFDGSVYGAGTFEVSTYINGNYARIDGTNMVWQVRRIE